MSRNNDFKQRIKSKKCQKHKHVNHIDAQCQRIYFLRNNPIIYIIFYTFAEPYSFGTFHFYVTMQKKLKEKIVKLILNANVYDFHVLS